MKKEVLFGSCKCGCERKTPLAKRTRSHMGHFKGFPVPYVQGHNTASPTRDATKRTTEWTAYENAKQRCTNPKRKGWKNWGGRGIEFRFKNFLDFLKELGRRPSPKYTVDRKNNDGHYEPGNVRWATRKQQIQNRRKK